MTEGRVTHGNAAVRGQHPGVEPETAGRTAGRKEASRGTGTRRGGANESRGKRGRVAPLIYHKNSEGVSWDLTYV